MLQTLVTVASVLTEETACVDSTPVDVDRLETPVTTAPPSGRAVEDETRRGLGRLAFSVRVVVGTAGCELRQVLVCDLAWPGTTGRLGTGRGLAVSQRQLERLLVCVDGTPVGTDDDVVVVVVVETGAGAALEVVDVAGVEIVAVVVAGVEVVAVDVAAVDIVAVEVAGVEIVSVDVLVAEVMGVDEVDATVSEPEVTVLAVVALDFVAAPVVAVAIGVLAAIVAPRAAAAATHPDGADMARALA